MNVPPRHRDPDHPGRLVFDLSVDPNATGKLTRVAPTRIDQVFASAGVLPENLLKFYIHFSAPMSRGEAYKHIRLLAPTGKPVADPFLELDEELWSRDQRRFTLLFDPGASSMGSAMRSSRGASARRWRSRTGDRRKGPARHRRCCGRRSNGWTATRAEPRDRERRMRGPRGSLERVPCPPQPSATRRRSQSRGGASRSAPRSGSGGELTARARDR